MSHAILVPTLALLVGTATSPQKAGDPRDRLPRDVEQVTAFGERASISPDGREIAFMAKSFGDAFAIDLGTRVIRCLTCHVPGAAFLRVMHLSNGDYLLIGPGRIEDPNDIGRGRGRDNQLWFLSRHRGGHPVALGVHNFEGAAVSKRSLLIGWSECHTQNPVLAKDEPPVHGAPAPRGRRSPRRRRPSRGARQPPPALQGRGARLLR